ncbi:MAG: hypothetical protein JXA24_03890 [Proteobacteria bacterium]|nr:hypothetical protein [Pseudomonadota bacterium]
MPRAKQSCGGGRIPCPAAFIDCAEAQQGGANVRPLKSDPGDTEAFARSLEGFGKLCRYPEGSRFKYGWYREPRPAGSKLKVESSKLKAQS